MTTAGDVAAFMQGRLEREGTLYQDDAAYAIEQQFGDDFVSVSDRSGATLIKKEVLSAFNKLNKDTVVWVRHGRYWRLRESADAPGRQQDG